MSNYRRPRRGSLQFWPRKRAKRSYARIRSWSTLVGTKLLGFIGYKTGMTQILVRDNTPTSRSKNLVIPLPITVIECPPLKPFSIRFYKYDDNRDLKIISEIFAKNMNKNIKRKTSFSKKAVAEPKEFDDIKLSVHTQPWLAGIKKKTPEILEIALSGDQKEKLKLAKELLEKEIKINDVFKSLQFVDTHSISKGKGFQGSIKRFGLKKLSHKSQKGRRKAGSLGPWHPPKLTFRVPLPGQLGYNQRTEHNKLLLKISSKPEEINPAGGFNHYGLIRNDFVLVKGSIAGPSKRTIILTEPMRLLSKKPPQYEIKSVI